MICGGRGAVSVWNSGGSDPAAAAARDLWAPAGIGKEQALGSTVAILSALTLSLLVAGCMPPDPPYPNVVPIDTTGNYGAR